MKKKILMLLDSEFPPDIRVENEAVSLIEAGFEVHILCLSHSGGLYYEEYKSIFIHRFNINRKLKNKLFGLYLVLPIYHNIWLKQVEKVLSDDFDFLHIHDLPFSDIGLKMKKKFGLKLVFDQHEYYSDWINKNKFMNTFSGKIVRRLSNWEKFEREVLPNGDLILTVAEPLKKAYLKKLSLIETDIICVPNTPDANTFNTETSNPDITERYKDDFVIFYAGGLDSLRGINVIIDSLKKLKAQIPNVKFVFAGNIGKSYNPVKHAEKAGVKECIEYLEYVDYNLLPSYYDASDVCIFIPMSNREEINKTIATKIYQFVQMEKPCIVGRAKLMKEFVMSYNIGLSIDEREPNELIEAIVKINKHPEISERIASNCKKIKADFVWEKTVIPMINKYKEL